MEDNKIIKALECCRDAAHNPDFCYECPYHGTENCTIQFVQDTLDFINRQKAEIERLQTALFKQEDTMQIIAKEKQQYFDELRTSKAEAVREFA